MKLCGAALQMHVVTYLLATATDAGLLGRLRPYRDVDSARPRNRRLR